MNIVITGSTKGIGLGMIKEFLKNRHDVVINGRNLDQMTQTLKALKALYPNRQVYGYTCDVSDYKSVSALYHFAEDQLGPVDVWINNAGIDQNRAFIWEHEIEKMHQVIDVNIKGVVNGTRIASEKMKASGGYIYNMEGFGSDGATTEKMALYGMTKRAVTYYTSAAAKEVEGSKVKIGLLSPGIVLTDFMKASLPREKERREKYLKAYNVLGDTVETVTAYLVSKILENEANGVRIVWLTKKKAFMRFMLQIFNKRKLEGLN